MHHAVLSRPVLAVALLLSSLPARADAPSRVVDPETPPPAAAEPAPAEDDPAVAGAREFLEETVRLVEKAKWKEFKARIHPFTTKVMEDRKNRTKRDDHNLSFWTHVKEWKIQKWEVINVEPGPRDTAIAITREDLFLIEEKGTEEGKDASWLLARVSGDGKGPARWWVLDRRNGSGAFTDVAIEKGFGDVLPKTTVEEEPKTPLAAYQKKLERTIRKKLEVPDAIPDSQLKNMSCTVKLMLDGGGTVLSRTVVKASGNPAYDKAVLRAVDVTQPFAAPEDALAEEAKTGIEVVMRARP
jgi:TonB family protein